MIQYRKEIRKKKSIFGFQNNLKIILPVEKKKSNFQNQAYLLKIKAIARFGENIAMQQYCILQFLHCLME